MNELYLIIILILVLQAFGAGLFFNKNFDVNGTPQDTAVLLLLSFLLIIAGIPIFLVGLFWGAFKSPGSDKGSV